MCLVEVTMNTSNSSSIKMGDSVIEPSARRNAIVAADFSPPDKFLRSSLLAVSVILDDELSVDTIKSSVACL